MDGYESAGTRAAFVSQQLAVTYAVNNNWNLTRWFSNTSSAPTVIDNFLNSTSVIQDPAKLTMSYIMIQKYIALSYSPELWVDLRRMNFGADATGNYSEAAGVYTNWKRPSHVYAEAYPNPTDWPRRFTVPSYEINYNIVEVLKANSNAANPTYLSEPVWWDKR